MKLFAVASILGLVAPAFSYTHTYTLSYDTLYDEAENSLAHFKCAHGEHGLLTHGYTTLHSLPTFPIIGGAPQIHGKDSRYCGSCWEITYTDAHGVSTSLNFTAIDTGEHNPDTFTISLEGLDALTHGKGKKMKKVPITVVRKTPSACGL